MKTLEQLNELSDYEINCAVAKKLGFTVEHLDNPKIKAAFTFDNGVNDFKDYTTDPSDYMPIAIEHGIDIIFVKEKVFCGYGVFHETDCMPRTQTGRAVCLTFLLLEIEK